MMWKQRLEIVREIATILSLIAVPLLIAQAGGNIQSRIAEQNINKEYVQLALDILREPKPEKENDKGELREWSLKIMNKYAPIPLPPEAAAQGLSWKGGRTLWAAEMPGGYAAYLGNLGSHSYSYSGTSCAEYYIITDDKEGLEKCLERLRQVQKLQTEGSVNKR